MLQRVFDKTSFRQAGLLRTIALIFLLLLPALALTACQTGSLTDGLQSAANPQPAQPVGGGQQALPGGTATLDPSIGADPNGPPPQPGGSQVASLPNSKAVTFLPVSNAPQSAVTQLAKSIRNEAGRSGVPVVGSVQQGAAYQVKGYFSALEDGSGTLLVYVWDILDRNNKRVYRINGQEQASGRSADPWGSVTPQMLDRVAQSTVSQLKSWLSTR
ncbi:MAG: hypothetical protein KDJ80_01810 [Nitratireductor sp.]|nr:hypothetical protein [Nitratireductor sp.]